MVRKKKKNPRILIVTPEITYLPKNMGNIANYLAAKGGGLADVSAMLVGSLYDAGVDVHVALPNFRKIFNVNVGNLINQELRIYKNKVPDERIHLAEDRVFYYRNQVYDDVETNNINIALVFQREVINNIIPRVRPDLIHCNDWMTGLIPALARRLNIPCLFTVHNIHTVKLTMAEIEDRGIDVAEFWQNLYLERMPANYEESRGGNPVDLLTSGVFASHFINTVSPTFLKEIIDGYHDFVPDNLRSEFVNKGRAGFAAGVLNSPGESYHPCDDSALCKTYDHATHVAGKAANKAKLQKALGLARAPDAPLFFWPSRLDPMQKGCQLLTDILYRLTEMYRDDKIQIAIVANGAYQKHFRDIVAFHRIHNRVGIADFNEALSRLAYAGSDFMLMPSLFEPCGLPQMICQKYGTMPIVHDTGGLHDTVVHLDIATNRGNGFVFRDYGANGLLWAFAEAMRFARRPADLKHQHISRIMKESAERFNHEVTARRYMRLYDEMIARPM